MNILFWSGGKDAFLALKVYQQEHPETEIQLLTTFEKNSEVVPHQNIPVEHIKKQAVALGLKLNLVALPPECANELYLKKIKQATHHISPPVKNLIFGDWHVRDIREWREEQFEKLGFTCRFPIWEKSIHDLLPMLLLQPVEIRISAVKDEYRDIIKAGELYNQQFVQQLPKEIDPLGEHGEFHTKVIFKSWGKQKTDAQPLI